MNGKLDEDENFVIVRMYEKRLYRGAYQNINIVERKIGWKDISKFCGSRKKFKKIARRLVNLELLTDSGKSLEVLSLDIDGIAYAKGLLTDSDFVVRYEEFKRKFKPKNEN